VPVGGGREAFERVVGSLEAAQAGGDARANLSVVERGLGGIARSARRGSVVVVLSDLLDLPAGAAERVAAAACRGRVLVVVQVLDPDEVDFPFEGTVRLRSLEGDTVVETDAELTRASYLTRLAALTDDWERRMTARGGRILRAATDGDPVRTVHEILQAARSV
jgi:uncharacterized protein (DUF58 family)